MSARADRRAGRAATRLVAIVAAVAALALAAGAAWWASSRAPAADPPPIPASLADPEVVRVLRELSDSVRASPRDGTPWARLAMAHHAQEMYPEANVCWSVATSLEPDEVRWTWLHAVALEGERRTDEALAVASRVLADRRAHAPAWATVATWLLGRGEVGRAVEHARRATELAPDDAGGWVVLAQALLDAGDAEAAERAARRALPLTATSPRQEAFVRFVLGRCLARLARDDEARRETARGRGSGGAGSAVADPWLADLAPYRVGFVALVQAAHDAIEVADYGAAIPLLRELQRRDPRHLQTAIDLGRALRETGAPEESLALLVPAVQRFPATPELRVELALTRERLGDLDGALREIAEGLARAPASGALFETRGLILLRADRHDEAIRDFEAALAADPDGAWVLVHAGVACLERDDLDGAARHFVRCAELDPGLADADAGLAIVAARRGDLAEAARRLAASRSLEMRETTLQGVAAEEIEAARSKR